MSFEFPNIELTEDALPRVPLQDVLDIQSLAMGRCLPISRTRKSERYPRVTGFVLLHETNPGVQDISELIQLPNEFGEYERELDVDTYLGVIVRKPHPRQWRFTISFLQNILSDQERLSCTRDVYRFEWRRGEDEALGTRRVIRSVGQLTAKSQADTENTLSFDYTEQRSRSVQGTALFPRDCEELRNKIITHTDLCLGLADVA